MPVGIASVSIIKAGLGDSLHFYRESRKDPDEPAQESKRTQNCLRRN